MAIMLSKESQKVFFQKVFGATWVEEQITPLLSAGVTLNVEFTHISAQLPNGSKIKISLPISTTSLMKKAGSPNLIQDCCGLIGSFINDVKTTLASSGASIPMPLQPVVNITASPAPTPSAAQKMPTASELVQDLLGIGLDEKQTAAEKWLAASLTEAIKKAGASTSPSVLSEIKFPDELEIPVKKPKTKKVSHGGSKELIQLKDASEIGQKVFGTSPDSVYTVVALNERVKVAIRPNGETLSVRAEFKDATDKEKLVLLKNGLKDSQKGHYSIHMDCSGVPIARVVGAFLFDSGIEFDKQIKSLKDIESES